MSTSKITKARLRQIVREEFRNVHEQVDHSSIRDIVNIASKLLAAVEGFKEKAPPSAMNAVTPQLTDLQKTLENMVSTPGSYVTKIKAEPQHVSLKPVKSENKQLQMEATGDGESELVDASNFEHLEVGNTYLVTVGQEEVKCEFKGWVDENGQPTEERDPNKVQLQFADLSDGMLWEAYFFEDKYCAGTSADPLYVQELYTQDQDT